ncbi:MAG: nucleotidyl transferase AbiEii/AbiGii toxin family protein [Bacillota bacterium]
MFAECVSSAALTLLETVGAAEDFRSLGFYLAGGTGLALQLGHRVSNDLDFFSQRTFDPELVLRTLARILPARVLEASPGTLHLIGNENVKVSLLFYPYKVVFPFVHFKNYPLADYRDIAAMKLIALGQRGTKRDFLDLFFLLRGKMTLRELKEIVEQKYTTIRYNWPHLVRSLGYFADAEEDPMPVLIAAGVKREMTQEEWREVKRFFLNLQREALLEMRQGGLRF